MPKISALPPLNNPADDDESPIVDKSASTTKKIARSVGSPPTLRDVKVYTADATWTKPANMTDTGFVIVEVLGGGGAGGGRWAPGGTTTQAGSGGGAGGYAMSKVMGADLGATVNVKIGAAGVGVSGGNGGSGGISYFGANSGSGNNFAQGSGGIGGLRFSGTSGGELGGAGGAALNGNLVNIPGWYGEGGWVHSGSTPLTSKSGNGADTIYGVGSKISVGQTGAGGTGAQGYGSGGSGILGSNQPSVAGSDGKPGLIIVREYY